MLMDRESFLVSLEEFVFLVQLWNTETTWVECDLSTLYLSVESGMFLVNWDDDRWLEC